MNGSKRKASDSTLVPHSLAGAGSLDFLWQLFDDTPIGMLEAAKMTTDVARELGVMAVRGVASTPMGTLNLPDFQVEVRGGGPGSGRSLYVRVENLAMMDLLRGDYFGGFEFKTPPQAAHEATLDLHFAPRPFIATIPSVVRERLEAARAARSFLRYDFLRFDASSWLEQLPCVESVRLRFGVRWKEGEWRLVE